MSGICTQSGMMRARPASGYDADAQTWFTAVEAVSSISTANKVAVSAFVAGCKSDGVWTAIKASCLLCAADDLTGALVPLVGSAPTSMSFVSGDYSRTLGLKSDGSTKYRNTNRSATADGQDDCHMAVWVQTAASDTATRSLCGTNLTQNHCHILTTAGSTRTRYRSGTQFTSLASATTGIHGVSRSSSASFYALIGSTGTTHTATSAAPSNINIGVFGRLENTLTDARLSFYSVGSALDLALLDARLATLMSALT